ncbi:MAG: hypothetical protein J6Y85_02755 [Alphaproteobacteria bacterium]|nr:hypothetical protein [Alphaproteobacteria bacterium]
MKKLFFFLMLWTVSPVFAQNATSFCSAINTRVNVKLNMSVPKYITTLSRQDFLKKAKGKASPYTLGLTVSQLQLNGDAKARTTVQNDKVCVGISELDIVLEDPDLTVYIDKKYTPSSCAYKAIYEHEKYHVAVSQQAMLFFKNDIEEALKKAVQSTPPVVISKNENVQTAMGRQFDSIMNKLEPLIKHINNKIQEKNAAIDTPESYAATQALCKHW